MTLLDTSGLNLTDSIGLVDYQRDVRALKEMKGSEDDGASLSKADLLKAARSFEAVLLNIMLRSMRETLNDSDIFGKGIGEDVYFDMLYNEYANLASSRLDTGIAEALYRQLGYYDKADRSSSEPDNNARKEEVNLAC